jgi:hypothetical protein
MSRKRPYRCDHLGELKKNKLKTEREDGEGGELLVHLNNKEEEEHIIRPQPFHFDGDRPPFVDSPCLDFDSTVGVFGPRRTGKTVFVTWFLHHFRFVYPEVHVFTNTKFNNWYAQFVNPKYIYQGWQPSIAAKILENQKRKIEDIAFKKSNENPFILIIHDDSLPGNAQWDEMQAKLYFFGRHYRICNVATGQDVKAIPAKHEGNMDLVVTLAIEDKRQVEAMWERFYGRYSEYDAFSNLVDMYTRDNHFLAFHNGDKSKRPEERVYWGKAEEVNEGPIWTVGNEKYWSNNRQHLEKIREGQVREEYRRLSKVEEELRKVAGYERPSKSGKEKDRNPEKKLRRT